MREKFEKIYDVGLKNSKTNDVIKIPNCKSLQITLFDFILFEVKKGEGESRFGLLNPDGKVVIPAENDKIIPYFNGIVCYVGQMSCVKSYSGETIIPLNKYFHLELCENYIQVSYYNGITKNFDYSGREIEKNNNDI